MWLKILPTTCQHAFFWGCLGGGALFTTADFHLLFLPFPNELVHWASLPAKEPKSSKRKRWGKSMSITHHKQRNNNDVWENKRFDIFGWKYGVNFSHIFPQRSTQIDSCSASEVSPDMTWNPLLPPMRLELKAEEQACSGSPGGPVTPNKQTNKQTGKQMELSYGSLWPLCLKSPFMNCTVRCDGVKVFMYKYGNRNTFDGFLLDNVFVSVRYPRWFLHTEMSSVPEGVQ